MEGGGSAYNLLPARRHHRPRVFQERPTPSDQQRSAERLGRFVFQHHALDRFPFATGLLKSSTIWMRWPIQAITGIAIELPNAR